MEANMVTTKKRSWQTYCQFGADFEAVCRQAVIASILHQYLNGV